MAPRVISKANRPQSPVCMVLWLSRPIHRPSPEAHNVHLIETDRVRITKPFFVPTGLGICKTTWSHESRGRGRCSVLLGLTSFCRCEDGCHRAGRRLAALLLTLMAFLLLVAWASREAPDLRAYTSFLIYMHPILIAMGPKTGVFA